VAELTLENRLLKKKRDGGWGGRRMRYPASEKLEIIRTEGYFVSEAFPATVYRSAVMAPRGF
jgi:hypothetical protein